MMESSILFRHDLLTGIGAGTGLLALSFPSVADKALNVVRLIAAGRNVL